MGYRESAAPERLRGLAECVWEVRAPRRTHVVPDGCMDLIEIDGTVVVAGPDTSAHLSEQHSGTIRGIRFRPGVLPRFLGVPAAELRDTRVPVRDIRPDVTAVSLAGVTCKILATDPRAETAPWSAAQLTLVTGRLAGGAAVATVAEEIGWTSRTVQRQCSAVYGYGPAVLRRVLRLRSAVGLLRDGVPPAAAAAQAGYADQPHLHREVRDLTGMTVSALRQPGSGANRSTAVPSGSTTLA